QYVRVQLSGRNYLSLAEGQVFGTAGTTSSSLQPNVITQVATNSLNAVRVYPNPFRSSRGDTSIILDQMAAGATLNIFTVAGSHVVTLTADTNGKATWNLLNASGDKVASGIYLYVITDSQGNKARGKLGVIK